MTRGWGAIARACGSKGRHALHFKYDQATTLFFKVFGEDGGRLECCLAGSSGSGVHPSDNGDQQSDEALGSELALGDVSDVSSSGGTSLGGSLSDDDYNERPCHRARVKEEEDTD